MVALPEIIAGGGREEVEPQPAVVPEGEGVGRPVFRHQHRIECAVEPRTGNPAEDSEASIRLQ